MKLIATIALVFSMTGMLFAADTGTKFINPEELSKPIGYTHVVIASGSRTVYIAGQVSRNSQGEVVGKGDLKAQTTQVFENLKTALSAAGATFSDVVKMNTYVVNHNSAYVPIFREIRSKYITGNPPASTFVGVQALALDDFLIEIEVIAVLSK